MENDAGEFVDLYCPRKWYVLFHVFKLSFLMEKKVFKFLVLVFSFFFKSGFEFSNEFSSFLPFSYKQEKNITSI